MLGCLSVRVLQCPNSVRPLGCGTGQQGLFRLDGTLQATEARGRIRLARRPHLATWAYGMLLVGQPMMFILRKWWALSALRWNDRS